MVGRLLTYTRARAHISLSFIYLTQIVTQREREQDPRVGAAGVALPSGGGGKLEGRNAVSAFLNRGERSPAASSCFRRESERWR